jgi:3-hydroxyisobutyrate dehydrogenase-like beta-hydroxyacid dehydrogenase
MTHPTGQRIGVIGLGAMGAPMALRLLEGHGEVHLAGRSPRPELVAAGATWHADYSSLAAACNVVLLMLPDVPEARAVLFSTPDGAVSGLLDGVAERGEELLLLIGSTSSAVAVRELAEEVSAASHGRVRLVDAPVSGGVDGAVAGTLSIMMGGGETECAAAAAALAPCGSAVRLGPVGAGEVAKACNQLVVSATILALGEATVLAERSGLDVQAMWDLLDGGYAGSRLLTTRKQRLVEHDDSPSGAAKYLLKDLRCGLEVAEATRTSAELLPALEATFARIAAAGLGDRDMSVTRRYIAGDCA